MATLQHSITRKGDVTVITIGGSLDAATAQTLSNKLNEELKKDAKLYIISMEKLDYIASAGMGILISFNEKLEKSKKHLRLCNMNSKIENIFKMLGFLNLFKVYKNEDDAIKAK